MKNGMDCLFNMGAYRRCLCYCIAVVALFSHAEFTDSDSQVLSTINVRVGNLSTIMNQLSRNGNIGSDLDRIRQYQSTINNEIISIDDTVTRIQSVISKVNFSNDSVRVIDTALRDRADNANAELQALNRKFDTFLDYYSNNLQNAASVQPWLYTNLSYSIDFFMDLNPDYDMDTAAGNSLLWIYRVLTNNSNAPIEEARIFWQWYREISPSRWHIFDALSKIYYAELPDDLSEANQRIYDELFEYPDFLVGSLQRMGDDLGAQYYYQYGTRELTATNQAILDAVRQINNGFHSSAFTDDVYRRDEQGTNSVFSPGFENVAIGLAGSFAPSIDSDLQKVNTNDIENIEDSQYSAFMRTMVSPNDELLTGFGDDINRFVSDLTGQIDNFQNVQEITLDFGTFTVFGVSQNLAFKISRPPAMYWSVIHYSASFLRVAICIWWAISIWSYMSSSKTQGALE